MKRLSIAAVAAMFAVNALHAQAPVPFKLGTFQLQGRTFVGIVRDSAVIDLAAADNAVPGRTAPAAADMRDLIARYDSSLRARIYAIVKAVPTTQGKRPAYVHDLSALKILPPVMPATLLNAAVNYRAHGEEMARPGVATSAGVSAGRAAGAPAGSATPATKSAPGIWERSAGDTRWNPYLFLKATSAIIAEGETIRIPVGRTQIDWECELGVVIKQEAFQVPVSRASDYIFTTP